LAGSGLPAPVFILEHSMPDLDNIIEALIFASDRPISVERLRGLLAGSSLADSVLTPETETLQSALDTIQKRYEKSVVQLQKVASGYRFQVQEDFAYWVSLLHAERPQKYSRALLETLVIIAYRQPVTRGDIEDIRGVTVSSQIMRTLQEREWIRVVGHKDVPGKPGLYATTKQFLDYFNLTSLEQLPPLSEVRDLAEGAANLDLAIAQNIEIEPVTAGDEEQQSPQSSDPP